MEEREEEDGCSVSHSSEALPSSPAHNLRQPVAEEEWKTQGTRGRGEEGCLPHDGSAQKSDGRVPLTNAVQALTGCPELHSLVGKVPVKILCMLCGYLMEQGTFICSFVIW